MVFDLNCWHDKAYGTEDKLLEQKYFELDILAKNNFLEEHKLFETRYLDSRRKFSVNKEYLDTIYPTLLNGGIYVPPTLLMYIGKRYELTPETIKDMRKLYYQKGWTRSVGGGLRVVHHHYSNPLNSKQLLMFEVWEFTLTYPEYSELFVEEWIEKDKSGV